MEQRFGPPAPGEEPLPPSLSTQPLFRNDEIVLFEDFLDNLATENEFLFHPKVPVSLSWDGFVTTKNRAFDDVKHSGLHFGSDAHFSPTNGYIATHKFVPAGYGHVHPQSTAQRSRQSSSSSRLTSRRPSIYESLAMVNSPAQAQTPRQDLVPPSYRPSYTEPLPAGVHSDSQNDSGSRPKRMRSPPFLPAQESQQGFARSVTTPSSPMAAATAFNSAPDMGSITQSVPPGSTSFADYNEPCRDVSNRDPLPDISTSQGSRKRPLHDDLIFSVQKKIKDEEGLGKQTLTAGEWHEIQDKHHRVRILIF